METSMFTRKAAAVAVPAHDSPVRIGDRPRSCRADRGCRAGRSAHVVLLHGEVGRSGRVS